MLYDLATLKTLSNNDETFIIDMLLTFKRTAPSVLERMTEYVTAGKFEATGREAHKLIPGVSFLGARELQELLVNIEETAKTGNGLENMKKLVADSTQMTNDLIRCFENDFPGKL